MKTDVQDLKTENRSATTEAAHARRRNVPGHCSRFVIRHSPFVILLWLILSAFNAQFAMAQGTTFTYQGRLNDGVNPANGIYDLQFTIYDSTNIPGTVVAGPITNSATGISNGLFTVFLDFGGGIFTGPDRWLEIAVRTNGTGAFTTLAARQLIAPTPYAISAANVGGVLYVETNTNGAPNVIAGSLLNGVDPGFVGAVIGGGGATNYSGFAYSNRVAANFSVVGGGIGNVNQSFGSVISGGVLNQIQTGGSYSGIASGGHNLIEANTDQAFIGGGYGNSIQSNGRSSAIGGGELNTNGAAYSAIAGGHNNVIEPTADSSAIGGGWLNYIQSGADQSVIAGGNADHILSGARESFIGGGFANVIQTNSALAFIGAGAGNTIGTNSSFSTIAGGVNNSIQDNAAYATIGGGVNNTIQTNAAISMIAGGHDNTIQAASFAVIGGGGLNNILSNSYDSVIAGGGYGMIQTNSHSSVIGGGGMNTIQTNAPYSSIGGGYLNTIQFNDFYSTIAGGGNNTIQTNAPYSTIGGGVVNTIQTNSSFSTIGGGYFNSVQSNAPYATIPGGFLNIVAGTYGFAAGLQAQALHAGAFVWGDSQYAPFASTANDQFSVRAQGGVRFVTSGAGMTLDGQSVLTMGSGISIQQNSSGSPNVIEGAQNNFVVGGIVGATISGGGATNSGASTLSNSVTANWGTVGGGDGNTAGYWATVGGGYENTASGAAATVAGGAYNTSSGNGAFVGGGGYGLSGLSGYGNTASGSNSVVGGGVKNVSTGNFATVGGGYANTNSGLYATIGGGFENTNSGQYGAVGGGIGNSATNFYATVGGGEDNIAGFIGTVGGGALNLASGNYATVGGGWNNQATNDEATVPGGMFDVAGGSSSLAAGYRAKAYHQGAFVWADSQNFDFLSTTNDQFLIRAQGGVGINKNNPASTLDVNGTSRIQGANNWDLTTTEGDFRIGNDTYRFKIGVANGGGGAGDVWMRAQGGTGRVFLQTPGGTTIYSNDGKTTGVALAAGGGAWSTLSDRNAKENFIAVDAREILQRVASLPLATWNYKSQEKRIRHIGPMAQDFASAFQVGEDDRHITTIDSEGVALAAIQGLNEKVETSSQKSEVRSRMLEERLEQKETEITELKKRLEALEQIVRNQKSN